MKKPLLITLLSFLIFQLNAQSNDIKKLEHGILFSPRIDFEDEFSSKAEGFGIEGGYYILKRIGKKGMISLDVRLGYTQSERDYFNVINSKESIPFFDTIIILRSGRLTYKNLSLAVPIKYRYQFSEEKPLFLLIGVNPYFNLWNVSNWKYDEFGYNRITDMSATVLSNQEEDLEQRFYSKDILLAGVGYKKGKLMFDVYFIGGNTRFENEYIMGKSKWSIAFNAYYRLN